MDFKTIYDHLKAGGYDVYPPAAHRGDCKSPYIVVRNGVCSAAMNMQQQEYELLVYLPYGKYAAMEDYLTGIKLHMNALYPAAKLIDYGEPVYPDDNVKAYMTTLTYAVKKQVQTNRITGG